MSTILDLWPFIAFGAWVACCVRPADVVGLFVRRALASGNEQRAARIAIRYVRLRPRDPRGWLLWAWLAEKQGAPRRSSAILEEGLEHTPDSLVLGLALARALLVEGREGEAHELLAALRQQHPDAPGPPTLLAWQAASVANWSDAVELCREARGRLDPRKDPEQAVELGHLLLLIPGERESSKEVLVAAAKHSVTPLPHVFLVALTESVDPQEARRHLARARYYWGDDREDLAECLEEVRGIAAPSAGA